MCTQKWGSFSLPTWLWRTSQKELTPYSVWLKAKFCIWKHEFWKRGDQKTSNYFSVITRGTQWEKLPANQIHLVIQIPACLVNSYIDKQKCFYINLINNTLVPSQNIRDQALLLAFTEFLSIYIKLHLGYLLPVEHFFIYMEQIQIYTSINQN